MNETKDIQDRFEIIAESVNVLTDTITSTMTRFDEKLVSIEKTLWMLHKKVNVQDKLFEELSSNSIIDGMEKRRILESKISPFHLQSEEYRITSARAARDNDEEE